MKKISKSLVSLAILTLVFGGAMVLAAPAPVHAALDLNSVGYNEINSTIQLGHTDPRTTIASIINTLMLFLGIIAVVIVLLGGFKWMTAMGNEDKVSEAKKLMGAGVIGLVIILAAWGIATFILQSLINATQ